MNLPSQIGGFQPPPFTPTRISSPSSSVLSSPTSTEAWIPIISSPCYFPLSVFLSTLKTLSIHPERNANLILRADPLPSSTPSTSSISYDHVQNLHQREEIMELIEQMRVRILPRQPRRDNKIDQTILFYRSKVISEEEENIQISGDGDGNGNEDAANSMEKHIGIVIIIPEVNNQDEIPYYHPKIKKLAYHYESISSKSKVDDDVVKPSTVKEDQGEEGKERDDQIQGIISIHYVPFPDDSGQSSDHVNGSGVGVGIGIDALSIDNGPSSSNLSSPPPILNPIPNSGSGSNATSESPDPDTSTLSPRPIKPRRRSPLAGPSIDDTSTESKDIKPPATIISPSSELQTESTNPHPKSLTTMNRNNNKKSKVFIKNEGEERLYRTCLALLETLHKHGYGQFVGYQKRRVHDVIVPRDNFQDLYLTLKDRHRHLDSRAPKQGGLISKLEDVKRHVWKGISNPDDPLIPTNVDLSEWGEQDIAIAAFLMLLWKDMYPPLSPPSNTTDQEEEREWDTWGRPEGGFIDLGCGNGLLVHILIAEGYHGKGYELRTRRTWPLYPRKTQDALIELPIDPPSWFPNTIQEWESGQWAGKEKSVIEKHTFLIGNHADELTPWLPLLSLIPTDPVPYLSLPCCLHTLDASFDSLQFVAPEHPHTPEGGFENGLEPGISRYQSYLVWLGWYGLKCGWHWEKEGLRVPSTKGWGIVARKRWTTSSEDRECREWVLEQVNQVRRKGAFKVREKEGKDHM
ncbi:uncharacterized protein IL334_006731 [Kwoniella shivajii]|uniref:tRNA (uracil-O(2)-)-methyltransferase n=1 Tax=Kwoniella shivajii TaxID=564305 RepID=A0ABZ1D8Q9_9TREE|nr:hypothetical protein IL334_006731 [Kwoniella shivajii]